MLTAEIRVNSFLIGHIAIHNTSQPDQQELELAFIYDYEVYMTHGPGGEPKHAVARGSLSHAYHDGALELIKKVIDDASSEIQEQSEKITA